MPAPRTQTKPEELLLNMTALEAKAKRQLEVKESGLSGREWYRKIYLLSNHWKELRSRFLETLESPCCQECGRVGRLDVHHLRYRNIYNVKLTDLQAVCRPCHKLKHNETPSLKAAPAPRNPRKPRQKKKKGKNKQSAGLSMSKKEAAIYLHHLNLTPIEMPFDVRYWVCEYRKAIAGGGLMKESKASHLLIRRLKSGGEFEKMLIPIVDSYRRRHANGGLFLANNPTPQSIMQTERKLIEQEITESLQRAYENR